MLGYSLGSRSYWPLAGYEVCLGFLFSIDKLDDLTTDFQDTANALPNSNGMSRGFGTMPIASGSSSISVGKDKGREVNAVPGPSTLGGVDR